MKRIWITWEKHRRTIELASALPEIMLFQIEFEGHRIVRYPYLLLRTAVVLLRQLPNLVMVQNPSVVLSFFIVILGKMAKFRVVVDAHNEGLTPFGSKHSWLLPIYDMIQKWAALTIVTNSELATMVSENGGQPFILEDKIPKLYNPNPIRLKGSYNLVFVCTFERDEPYTEVIQAASLLEPSICLHITGRCEKAPFDLIKQSPSNVVFTGFLPDQNYLNLLYSCDIVIDLTLMQNCLVCGAYEAVALGKPMILSDTEALRRYFSKGAVYTENTAQEIANAITYALQNKESLAREISVLKTELELQWKWKFSNLIDLLDQLAREP